MIKRLSSVRILLLALSAVFSVSARGETFVISGVALPLQEITTNTGVYFRSMRFNRALNQWNLEVTVSNRSPQAISGPLVLLVESFRGTTGPLLADGNLPGGAPRAFYDLSGFISNGELAPAQSTTPRTLSLGFSTGSPVLVTRVFAGVVPSQVPLGVTRTLDDVGQPLAGATLTITPPSAGQPSVQNTDRPSGVASFGEASGTHVLKFSKEGSLSVWRQQTLSSSNVAVVANPRLTPRSPRAFEVTPLGGTVVTNEAGTLRIAVNAGAFSGSATVRVTSLTGQTLPAFLPLGWSPLNAFALETSSEPIQTLTASLKPAGPVGPPETVALARWNETTLEWDVVQTQFGTPAEFLNVTLPGSGSFALVVGDKGALSPPPAVANQPDRKSVV